MIETLQSFIENTRFEHILAFLGIYLFILWLLVPIWVFLDSRKKFSNQYLPFVFFALILPFNIPGLIFYIIIRPDDYHVADMNHDGQPDAFFTVPMVHFLSDKKDLVMSMELKINSELIQPDARRDLQLQVDMQANDTTVRVEEPVQEQGDKEKVSDTDSSTGFSASMIQSRISHTLQTIKSFFLAETDADSDTSDIAKKDSTPAQKQEKTTTQSKDNQKKEVSASKKEKQS